MNSLSTQQLILGTGVLSFSSGNLLVNGSIISGGGGTIGNTGSFLTLFSPSASTYTPISGTTVTLNCGITNEHFITMPGTGNISMATSGDAGNQKFIVSLTWPNGASGSGTWFNTIRWAGGGYVPVQTSIGTKRDTFGFIRISSGNYDGFIMGQNI